MNKKTLSVLTASLVLGTATFAEETLEDITVVSVNKTVQSIKNTTSNITVITTEEIEENGYQNVAEALRHTTGLSITTSGGLGQPASLFTRGLDGSHILILIDGVRLNDPSTPNGAATLGNIPTENIAQIEIIKSGAGSIWGSNASAGVINIITKNAQEGTHGALKLSYGSHATKDINGEISYKKEGFSLYLQAAKLKTDGISAKSPADAEEDGYENKNYTVKLGYDLNENNKIQFSFDEIKSDFEYDNANADDPNAAGQSKQRNYALSYAYTQDAYALFIKADKGNIKRENISITDTNNYYYTVNEADTKDLTIINRFNYNNNQALLGLEYRKIDGYNSYQGAYFGFPSSSLSDDGYTNKALFLSSLYHINANTLLETNIRYDAYNVFDNEVSYKTGIKHHHHFLEGFTTSANYYRSYDAPSTYQYTNIFVGERLKPSYTKGYDITAAYKDLISVSYFKNHVENKIGYLYDPATFTGGYKNFNGTETYSGIEIEGEYLFSTLNLTLSANYTKLFQYEGGDGNDLIRRPKETLNVALDYYMNDDTHFGLLGQYIGDRTDLDFSTFPTTEVSTGNYSVWNFNINTRIYENIDLGIHAKNIFDKAYQSVYGYATEGRSVYVDLKYSF